MKCRNVDCINPDNGNLTQDQFKGRRVKAGGIKYSDECKMCYSAKLSKRRKTAKKTVRFGCMSAAQIKLSTWDVRLCQSFLLRG